MRLGRCDLLRIYGEFNSTFNTIHPDLAGGCGAPFPKASNRFQISYSIASCIYYGSVLPQSIEKVSPGS